MFTTMDSVQKYALVKWIDDQGQPWGIVNLKNDSVIPEKQLDKYSIGENIEAPCRGFKGKHRCRIFELSGKLIKVIVTVM